MPDNRREQAEAWAAGKMAWPRWQSTAISSDASFRRYFRLSEHGQSVVVMDAPPDREPVNAFIDIANRLKDRVHVPQILAEDRQQGFVLLEDLGSQPFHLELNPANADQLFGDAMNALLRIQTTADTDGMPAYDPALLMRELALFPDWFLARHWQVEPSDDELDGWDHVCATLIRWALDQPQVFCHRDYMPRNLMVATPNPGVIDFQDAVRGPISYDPVCLFRDAFLSWPQAQVDTWLESYRQRAIEAGLPMPGSAELWRRSCDLMGAQRHLKVIGIFARIRYRDGKPKYLEDAPRFFDYLAQAISRNPELAELGRLLASWQARRSVAG
jgi:N-acetylmuramate 1-kinase